MFGKIPNFFSETFVELKKVNWSSRREVIDSTMVILMGSIFLGIFITVADFILSKIVAILIKW